MNRPNYSVCPVVRRETMHLFERVEVGGMSRLLPFDRQVLWLRESETKIVIRHRGCEVAERSTLNDYYGFLTSLESAITDDIANWAKSLKLDATCDLEICADLTVTEVPVLEDRTPEGIEHNDRYPEGRKQYQSIPSYYNGGKWWFTSDQPADPSDKYSGFPTLEPVKTVTRKSAYTTLRRKSFGKVPADLAKWIASQRAAAKESELSPAPTQGEGTR